MKRARRSKLKRYLSLLFLLYLMIGLLVFVSFSIVKNIKNHMCTKDESIYNTSENLDAWRYRNSVTGQWYHWNTNEKQQLKWNVKWFNSNPTSSLGVIVYLVTRHELRFLEISIIQLSYLKSTNPRPIVIFHQGDFDDNFTQHSLAKLAGSDRPLAFERIEFINQANQPQSVHRRYSIGYFHMCRFFTLMLPFHPLLTLFTFYWRLDGHSYIFGKEAIGDPFELMEKRNIQYAFVMANEEAEHYVTGLWSLFHKFLYQNCLETSKVFQQTQMNWFGRYSYQIIFTNFAIANVSIFRDHSLIRSWLHKVDHSHGIYRYRWGDAPIHTLILMQFLEREQIVRLRYFGYIHRYDYVCPTEQNKNLCRKQLKSFKGNSSVNYKYYHDGCYPASRNRLCYYFPEIKF